MSVAEHNAFVAKHTWRNFWLNVADGGVYTIGMALVPAETVLPGFVSECASRIPWLAGYKNTLVGLLALIIAACFMMPQQLWAAKLCEGRLHLKKLLIVVAVLERLPWFFMGMMAALVAGARPLVALGLFFVIMFSYHFILGIVSPIWQEVVAKVTPLQKRGILFGVRESLGGACGFLTLLAVNSIVAKIEFPNSYTVLFFGAFILVLISAVPLFFLKEAPYTTERRERPMRDYLKDVRDILRTDKAFQKYFYCRAVLSLAGVACAPLFAVRAIEVLGAEATLSLMVRMTIVIILARTVISVFIGQMGDWFGYRVIMVLAALAAGFSIIAALVASSQLGFYAAYTLSTFSALAFWLGHSNYILELAPLEKRPSYISLDNMAGLPFVAAPIIGGILADRFGYSLPFILGAVLAIAAAALFFIIAVEPRKAAPVEPAE